jgi:hypothetical protein
MDEVPKQTEEPETLHYNPEILLLTLPISRGVIVVLLG